MLVAEVSITEVHKIMHTISITRWQHCHSHVIFCVAIATFTGWGCVQTSQTRHNIRQDKVNEFIS